MSVLLFGLGWSVMFFVALALCWAFDRVGWKGRDESRFDDALNDGVE